MKKVLIAAVFASVSSMATAQVGISGKLGSWMDSTKVGGARTDSMVTEPTSNITVTAKEQLGNGLTARVVVDTRIGGNTFDGGADTRFGDRQSTVGVAGKMGSVDLGRNVHNVFGAITSSEPFDLAYGSIGYDIHNVRGLRYSSGAFVSVKPLNNVTVGFDRSNTAIGPEQTSASLSASLMGINAVVARYENGVEKSTVLGANTKLGKTTGLFFSHSDNESAVAGETKKGNLVGATQNMGAFTLKGSYGKTNTDVRAYNVGVDYHLSKRTDVGIAYRNVDSKVNAQDVAQVALGLIHRF